MIKNCLACIKTAARNQFNLKASINSILYQLRICRQKTINISPFEAHFGRKANTPLGNISSVPNPSSLTYKTILKKYLVMETVRWEDLISEDPGHGSKTGHRTRSIQRPNKQRCGSTNQC